MLESKYRGVEFPVKEIQCRAVLSNANVKYNSALSWEEHFNEAYINEVKAVRNNTSSCQVYMGIKKGETNFLISVT